MSSDKFTEQQFLVGENEYRWKEEAVERALQNCALPVCIAHFMKSGASFSRSQPWRAACIHGIWKILFSWTCWKVAIEQSLNKGVIHDIIFKNIYTLSGKEQYLHQWSCDSYEVKQHCQNESHKFPFWHPLLIPWPTTIFVKKSIAQDVCIISQLKCALTLLTHLSPGICEELICSSNHGRILILSTGIVSFKKYTFIYTWAYSNTNIY